MWLSNQPQHEPPVLNASIYSLFHHCGSELCCVSPHAADKIASGVRPDASLTDDTLFALMMQGALCHPPSDDSRGEGQCAQKLDQRELWGSFPSWFRKLKGWSSASQPAVGSCCHAVPV